MQNNTKVNFFVGLFVLFAAVGLLFLALQASNLTSFTSGKTYEVTAYFDNIGGLKVRALSEVPVLPSEESKAFLMTTINSKPS